MVIPGSGNATSQSVLVPNNPFAYHFMRDISIMIFFGFAYLMTFLRRTGYAGSGPLRELAHPVQAYKEILSLRLFLCLKSFRYSAVGYTLLISAMVVQWSIPLQHFFEAWGKDDGEENVRLLSFFFFPYYSLSLSFPGTCVMIHDSSRAAFRLESTASQMACSARPLS